MAMSDKCRYGRSNAGVIHIKIGPRAVACNSRNNGVWTSTISEKTAAAAAERTFCKKCFPNGKPGTGE